MTSSAHPNRHSEPPDLAQRLARAPDHARTGLLLEWLRRTIGELSGRDDPRELRPEQKLFEVGLKSLHLNELRSRLERECGVEFPVALFFTHTTLHAVAEHVVRETMKATDRGGADRDSAPPSRAGREPASASTSVARPPPRIAVVGMGCRFPGGADSIEAFWKLLRDGRSAISRVPSGRFDLAALYDPDPDKPGRMYMRHGGFLDSVDGFDAEFFKISPREAAQIDPQQRLFLEVAWEALEDAGISAEALAGSPTAVVAGVLSSDYAHVGTDLATRVDAHYFPGVNGGFIAGRLSYFLGTRGPSLTVDTTCSSSLVAVHLACQSLLSGEADLALAGGVNLILSPEVSVFLCKAKVMSPTGACRAFDAAADGMVRGEGCGVVVLKRLADAVRDGDRVLAIVRGSAVNHDGASGGLTVPSPDAQAALYRQALARAGVAPAEVGYVEAHGTGTHLGDPIELTSLAEVYGAGRPADAPLLIGSVKTNLGHTDSAAGIANFIKAVEILRHREIPASLHFERPNPNFRWDDHPLRVAARRTELKESGGACRVGVSAFGLNGVNAHVVLEESRDPDVEEESARRASRPHVMSLSARTPEALRAAAADAARALAGTEAGRLEGLCSTLLHRRSRFENRLAVVGRSAAELRARLDEWLADPSSPSALRGVAAPGAPRGLAFLFSGQGPQWWAMGRELLRDEPAFRRKLERIDEIFLSLAGFSLLDQMAADEAVSRIDETAIAQPAMFAMQVGLVALWRELGVEPAIVLGHSMGEVAAAHVSGALSLEDAVKVIYHRGRILEQATGKGKMAAVGLARADVEALLEPHLGRVAIAAHNGPKSVVISGDARAMDEILAGLQKRNAFFRELRVRFASHCPQMEAHQAELEEAVQGIAPQPPSIPIVSTLRGELARAGDFTPAYWANNLRATVRFAQGIDLLIDQGIGAFLEIDPHPILENSVAQCLEARNHEALVVGSLHHDKSDAVALFETLARLHLNGFALPLERIYPDRRNAASLPHYPWQRKRFWLKDGSHASSATARPAGESAAATGAWAGALLPSPLPERQFEARWMRGIPAALEGHVVAGRALVPAAAWLALARHVARICGIDAPALRSVSWPAPLALTDELTTVQLVLGAADARGERQFQAFSRSADGSSWTLHSSGQLGATHRPAPSAPLDLAAEQARLKERPAADFYDDLRARGYEYAGSYRSIDRLFVGPGVALASVVPIGASGGDGSLAPALLDGCLHAVVAALASEAPDALFLPIGLEEFAQSRPAGGPLWSFVRVRSERGNDAALVTADIRIVDGQGGAVAEVRGLKLRQVEASALAGAEPARASGLYEVAWRPQPLEQYDATRREESWLLFVDSGSEGSELAQALAGRGQRVTVVRAGRGFTARDDGSFEVDPIGAQDCVALLHELERRRIVPSQVVDLRALDATCPDDATAADLLAGQERSLGGALHLLQALAAAAAPLPRICLVTRGAVAVRPGESPLAAQSSLVSLGKVIELEHPATRCTSIDLDPADPASQTPALLRELLFMDERETQVAFRFGQRHVARLARRVLPVTPGANRDGRTSSSLRIDAYGSLDRLAIVATERRPPGAGEVEIEMAAAGLNFRDVLSALGMLDDYVRSRGVNRAADLPFGHEGSGTVTAVGPGVDSLRAGDEVVVALAPGSLSTHVVARAPFVTRKPERLSHEEAATLPIAFLTAAFALFEIAKLKKGERVLIHAAAGGVGLAAVQLARRAGAEVFATASPAKHETLKRLGVSHLYHSRNLDFAEQVRRDTGGRGVDVVLNSLRGEFASKSLDLLAEKGRFVEIGKIELLSPADVKRRRPDVAYEIFDLEQAAERQPERVAARLVEIVDQAGRGELAPLPRENFDFEHAAEAFRLMAQAKHVGKLILALPAAARRLASDGCHLVTGAFGGLGLRIARWLVDGGARDLVLVGRRAPSAQAVQLLDELKGRGARLRIELVDLGDAAAVAALFERIEREAAPLRGLFHAAVALDDGVLLRQDLARFRTVLQARVAGSWNLDRQTRALKLDHFVCFSSTASVLGSTGQGNYAAGSAFMDALMAARRARGLPGLSINWGPWAESGLAAELAEADRARWRERGVRYLPPEEALATLGRLLDANSQNAAVVEVDWSRYLAQLSASGLSRFLSELGRGEGPREAGLKQRMAGKSREESIALITAHARAQIGKVLGRSDPERIQPRQRLFDLGLDSLMAVELRNRIEQGTERALPSTLLFDYPTLESLVGFLAGELLGPEAPAERATPAAAVAPVSPGDAAADGELAGLSEDQLADLLARELDGSSERGAG